MNEKIFNELKLNEWYEIDPTGAKDFICEIIDIFLSTAPDLYTEMKAHWGDGHLLSVSKKAHTLKSMCANVGLEFGYKILNRIEASYESGNNEQIKEDIEQLDSIFDKMLAELKEFKGQQTRH